MVSSAEKGKESSPGGDWRPEVTGPQKVVEQRKAMRKAVFFKLFLFALVAAVVGGAWWLSLQGHEETDDAFIDAHISNISSRISGTVTRVFVTDNQDVQAGAVLAELDPSDYQVKVDQAQASLDSAEHEALAAKNKIDATTLNSQGQTSQSAADVSAVQAQVEAARFEISQTQADIKRMETKIKEQEAQVRFAQADYERYKSVYEEHVVTKQQFDKAKEAYDVTIAQLQECQNSLQFEHEKEKQARSHLSEALERVKVSKAGVTMAMAGTHQEKVDQEEYERAAANARRAKAALKQAQLDLSYTKLVAPVSGRIGHRALEVGQRVEAGQLLLAIVQNDPWVTANYKETQVGRMRKDQPAEIKIDSYPGRTFGGYVDSLSPASGAKFSMLPPDNATGNFTKVVQRVSVKIVFDKKAAATFKDEHLAPGMSCVVTVRTK